MKPEWEDRPFHAHWHSEARDCDGLYTRSGVYRQTNQAGDGYQREWDDDLDLMDILVVWAYKLPDWDDSTLKILRGSNGWMIESGRQTDEGWEALHVEMCQDPWCDLGEKPTFRDHTAEAAGY